MPKEYISFLQLILNGILASICGALAQLPASIGLFPITENDMLSVITAPNLFLIGVIIQVIVTVAASLIYKKIPAKKYFQDRVRGFLNIFDSNSYGWDRVVGDFTLITLGSFPIAFIVSLLISKPYPLAFFFLAGVLPAFYCVFIMLTYDGKKEDQ